MSHTKAQAKKSIFYSLTFLLAFVTGLAGFMVYLAGRGTKPDEEVKTGASSTSGIYREDNTSVDYVGTYVVPTEDGDDVSGGINNTRGVIEVVIDSGDGKKLDLSDVFRGSALDTEENRAKGLLGLQQGNTSVARQKNAVLAEIFFNEMQAYYNLQSGKGYTIDILANEWDVNPRDHQGGGKAWKEGDKFVKEYSTYASSGSGIIKYWYTILRGGSTEYAAHSTYGWKNSTWWDSRNKNSWNSQQLGVGTEHRYTISGSCIAFYNLMPYGMSNYKEFYKTSTSIRLQTRMANDFLWWGVNHQTTFGDVPVTEIDGKYYHKPFSTDIYSPYHYERPAGVPASLVELFNAETTTNNWAGLGRLAELFEIVDVHFLVAPSDASWTDQTKFRELDYQDADRDEPGVSDNSTELYYHLNNEAAIKKGAYEEVNTLNGNGETNNVYMVSRNNHYKVQFYLKPKFMANQFALGNYEKDAEGDYVNVGSDAVPIYEKYDENKNQFTYLKNKDGIYVRNKRSEYVESLYADLLTNNTEKLTIAQISKRSQIFPEEMIQTFEEAGENIYYYYDRVGSGLLNSSLYNGQQIVFAPGNYEYWYLRVRANQGADGYSNVQLRNFLDSDIANLSEYFYIKNRGNQERDFTSFINQPDMQRVLSGEAASQWVYRRIPAAGNGKYCYRLLEDKFERYSRTPATVRYKKNADIIPGGRDDWAEFNFDIKNLSSLDNHVIDETSPFSRVKFLADNNRNYRIIGMANRQLIVKAEDYYINYNDGGRSINEDHPIWINSFIGNEVYLWDYGNGASSIQLDPIPESRISGKCFPYQCDNLERTEELGHIIFYPVYLEESDRFTFNASGKDLIHNKPIQDIDGRPTQNLSGNVTMAGTIPVLKSVWENRQEELFSLAGNITLADLVNLLNGNNVGGFKATELDAWRLLPESKYYNFRGWQAWVNEEWVTVFDYDKGTWKEGDLTTWPEGNGKIVELYARWEGKEVNLCFYGQEAGGDAVHTITVKYGSYYLEKLQSYLEENSSPFLTPTKEGYHFTGYMAGGDVIYSYDEKEFSAEVILTSFGSSKQVSVGVDETTMSVELRPTFTENKYTFEFWAGISGNAVSDIIDIESINNYINIAEYTAKFNPPDSYIYGDKNGLAKFAPYPELSTTDLFFGYDVTAIRAISPNDVLLGYNEVSGYKVFTLQHSAFMTSDEYKFGNHTVKLYFILSPRTDFRILFDPNIPNSSGNAQSWGTNDRLDFDGILMKYGKTPAELEAAALISANPQALPTINVPIYSGHTFLGWSTDKTAKKPDTGLEKDKNWLATIKNTPVGSLAFASDRARITPYFAVWAEDYAIIRYDLGNGTFVESGKLKYGEDLDPETVLQSGLQYGKDFNLMTVQGAKAHFVTEISGTHLAAWKAVGNSSESAEMSLYYAASIFDEKTEQDLGASIRNYWAQAVYKDTIGGKSYYTITFVPCYEHDVYAIILDTNMGNLNNGESADNIFSVIYVSTANNTVPMGQGTYNKGTQEFVLNAWGNNLSVNRLAKYYGFAGWKAPSGSIISGTAVSTASNIRDALTAWIASGSTGLETKHGEKNFLTANWTPYTLTMELAYETEALKDDPNGHNFSGSLNTITFNQNFRINDDGKIYVNGIYAGELSRDYHTLKGFYVYEEGRGGGIYDWDAAGYFKAGNIFLRAEFELGKNYSGKELMAQTGSNLARLADGNSKVYLVPIWEKNTITFYYNENIAMFTGSINIDTIGNWAERVYHYGGGFNLALPDGFGYIVQNANGILFEFIGWDLDTKNPLTKDAINLSDGTWNPCTPSFAANALLLTENDILGYWGGLRFESLEVILYQVWQPHQYEVYLNINDGRVGTAGSGTTRAVDGAGNSVDGAGNDIYTISTKLAINYLGKFTDDHVAATQEEKNRITALLTPKRAGYIFKGWEDVAGPYNINTPWDRVGTITLTARWEAIKYSVQYNTTFKSSDGMFADTIYENVNNMNSVKNPQGANFGGTKEFVFDEISVLLPDLNSYKFQFDYQTTGREAFTGLPGYNHAGWAVFAGGVKIGEFATGSNDMVSETMNGLPLSINSANNEPPILLDLKPIWELRMMNVYFHGSDDGKATASSNPIPFQVPFNNTSITYPTPSHNKVQVSVETGNAFKFWEVKNLFGAGMETPAELRVGELISFYNIPTEGENKNRILFRDYIGNEDFKNGVLTVKAVLGILAIQFNYDFPNTSVTKSEDFFTKEEIADNLNGTMRELTDLIVTFASGTTGYIAGGRGRQFFAGFRLNLYEKDKSNQSQSTLIKAQDFMFTAANPKYVDLNILEFLSIKINGNNFSIFDLAETGIAYIVMVESLWKYQEVSFMNAYGELIEDVKMYLPYNPSIHGSEDPRYGALSFTFDLKSFSGDNIDGFVGGQPPVQTRQSESGLIYSFKGWKSNSINNGNTLLNFSQASLVFSFSGDIVLIPSFELTVIGSNHYVFKSDTSEDSGDWVCYTIGEQFDSSKLSSLIKTPTATHTYTFEGWLESSVYLAQGSKPWIEYGDARITKEGNNIKTGNPVDITSERIYFPIFTEYVRTFSVSIEDADGGIITNSNGLLQTSIAYTVSVSAARFKSTQKAGDYRFNSYSLIGFSLTPDGVIYKLETIAELIQIRGASSFDDSLLTLYARFETEANNSTGYTIMWMNPQGSSLVNQTSDFVKLSQQFYAPYANDAEIVGHEVFHLSNVQLLAGWAITAGGQVISNLNFGNVIAAAIEHQEFDKSAAGPRVIRLYPVFKNGPEREYTIEIYSESGTKMQTVTITYGNLLSKVRIPSYESGYMGNGQVFQGFSLTQGGAIVNGLDYGLRVTDFDMETGCWDFTINGFIGGTQHINSSSNYTYKFYTRSEKQFYAIEYRYAAKPVGAGLHAGSINNLVVGENNYNAPTKLDLSDSYTASDKGKIYFNSDIALTFEMRDASGSVNVPKFTEQNIPNTVGYRWSFKGWYLDQAGNTKLTFSDSSPVFANEAFAKNSPLLQGTFFNVFALFEEVEKDYNISWAFDNEGTKITDTLKTETKINLSGDNEAGLKDRIKTWVDETINRLNDLNNRNSNAKVYSYSVYGGKDWDNMSWTLSGPVEPSLGSELAGLQLANLSTAKVIQLITSGDSATLWLVVEKTVKILDVEFKGFNSASINSYRQYAGGIAVFEGTSAPKNDNVTFDCQYEFFGWIRDIPNVIVKSQPSGGFAVISTHSGKVTPTMSDINQGLDITLESFRLYDDEKESQDFYAVYREIPREYTLTVQVVYDKVSGTVERYETIPTFYGQNFAEAFRGLLLDTGRLSDAKFFYALGGWKTSLGGEKVLNADGTPVIGQTQNFKTIIGDLTLITIYDEELRNYEVTWNASNFAPGTENYVSVVIEVTNVNYGATAVTPNISQQLMVDSKNVPLRYAFLGWIQGTEGVLLTKGQLVEGIILSDSFNVRANYLFVNDMGTYKLTAWKPIEGAGIVYSPVFLAEREANVTLQNIYINTGTEQEPDYIKTLKEIYEEPVLLGTMLSVNFANPANHPFKSTDNEYTYSFLGWRRVDESGNIINAEAMINKTQQIPAPTVKDNYYYVAIFERTLREYIIEWYSYDFYTGKPVSFTTLSGNYDDDIGFLIKQNYPSQDKQKTREFTYGLSKDPYLWTFSENNITETAIGIRKENLGNMLKKAKELNSSSDSVVNNTTIKIYSVYAKSAREYNVTFYVEEKPKNQIFKFGSLPEFSGDVPNKPSDSMVYTFEGWYHQKISYYPGMPGLIVNNYFIDPVDKDLVFYAMFSSVPRMMKVEFLDYNGNVIYSRNDIAYGAAVTISTITNIDLRTPSKPSDSQYYYIFRGWDGGVHAQNSASLVNDNYIAHADADLIGNQAIMPYFEKVHIPTFEGQKSNGKLKVVILQSDKDFSATYRWERKNTITGNWDLVASTRDKNYSVTAVPEAQYQVIITHDVTAQLWTRTVTDFTEVVGPGPVDPDGSDFPIAIVAGAAGGALAAIAGIFLVVHFLKKRRLGDGDELF